MRGSKLIRVSLAALSIMLSFASAVYAETSVTYVGGAENFVYDTANNLTPTDLFEEFKGIMPGDHLEQTINIRNDDENGDDVEVFMRAVGAEEGSEDFLSKLTLSVMEKSSTLYTGPADQTGSLTEWVSLGKLSCGGKATLSVSLDVPLSLDNTYKNTVGILDWQFRVVKSDEPDEPYDPDDPDDTDSDNPGGSGTYHTKTGDPRTGDDNSIVYWACLCGISMGCIILLLLTKRNNDQKDN